MIPKALALRLGGVVLGAAFVAESRQVYDADFERFPQTVWREQKEVTQIPWTVSIGKPLLRADLRQELNLGVGVRSDIARDSMLFARVLERGRVIGSWAVTAQGPESPTALGWRTRPIWFSMNAIVRPGKYRLELALQEPATGRYSTRFEDITIEGNENHPLERSFEAFSKFEFVPERKADEFRQILMPPIDPRTVFRDGGYRSPVLSGRQLGFTPHPPTFLINRPIHLSVITILDPPDSAAGNVYLSDLFHTNLLNLLAVFTRLDVTEGTAQLTGLDLGARMRVFDRVDMKGITRETLDLALKRDATTVTLDNLAGASDRGRFLRDILQERLDEATKDNSGARHAVIVVSAANAFPNSSALALPAVRDCHCQIYYTRFALRVNERDDIDNILSAYKPRLFEPFDWRQFREQFGRIYEQLLR